MRSTRKDAPRAQGEVVTAHGRHYEVELDDGTRLRCYPRGKRSEVACGDRVQVQVIAADQGVIEATDARSTLFYRADSYKQKLIAANVTRVAIVVAGTPSYYDELVTRCLVAAHTQEVGAFIVLNKCDLEDATRAARARLAVYRDLGYDVLELSARGDLTQLRAALTSQRTVLVGQSGMGKSTLVNGLVPEAGAREGEISQALDSGRHTTTATRLYKLDEHSALIDSPGMQEFGIAHLSPQQLMAGFPEFADLLGHCRFADCVHLREPGCAVEAAGARIHPERLRAYRKLAVELRDAPRLY